MLYRRLTGEFGVADDLAGRTVRTGFGSWPWPFPWLPFRDSIATIVEPSTGAEPAELSHQVLTTLRTSGADAPAVCAVIGDVELESVRSGSAASVPLVGLLEKAADEISGRSEARIRRLQLVRYIVTLAINP